MIPLLPVALTGLTQSCSATVGLDWAGVKDGFTTGLVDTAGRVAPSPSPYSLGVSLHVLSSRTARLLTWQLRAPGDHSGRCLVLLRN